VFDCLHDGHHNLLEQASQYGTEIYVLVARDNVTKRLKNKSPIQSEEERVSALNNHSLVTKAFLGDEREGEYLLLQEINPDKILLGYDQHGLRQDLENKIEGKFLPGYDLHTLKPYKPNIYKSSLLNS